MLCKDYFNVLSDFFFFPKTPKMRLLYSFSSKNRTNEFTLNFSKNLDLLLCDITREISHRVINKCGFRQKGKKIPLAPLHDGGHYGVSRMWQRADLQASPPTDQPKKIIIKSDKKTKFCNKTRYLEVRGSHIL